ncbi:MAG: NINE protein [Pseudanabaenaceae cyanobacterium]
MKNRATAILLCFFLGCWGVHKFYLGETGMGVWYLLAFTILLVTVVSPIIAGIQIIFDFFVLLFMSDAEFDRKYNMAGGTGRITTSAQDATRALADLKKLYDDGVITAEEYEQKRQSLLRQL